MHTIRPDIIAIGGHNCCSIEAGMGVGILADTRTLAESAASMLFYFLASFVCHSKHGQGLTRAPCIQVYRIFSQLKLIMGALTNYWYPRRSNGVVDN